jgi:chromosome segregation ATPase
VHLLGFDEDIVMAAKEIELLRAEIADLTQRLEAADSDKTKAGEYGLKLIEEKGILEGQLEQLSNEYETVKTELESTREVGYQCVINLYQFVVPQQIPRSA